MDSLRTIIFKHNVTPDFVIGVGVGVSLSVTVFTVKSDNLDNCSISKKSISCTETSGKTIFDGITDDILVYGCDGYDGCNVYN